MVRKVKKSITRRTFMKGTGASAGMIAATGTGLLGNGLSATQSAKSAKSKTYSFETPPPPIPAAEIKQRISTEVVVIGAGTSGLVCANAAAESGAEVIVIASSAAPVGSSVPTRPSAIVSVSHRCGWT